jgi:hypothetical protein
VQLPRVAGAIKSLPTGVFRVRFQIGHLDRHPFRIAGTIGADLNANNSPGCVISSPADRSKLVDFLMIVPAEDRL